MRLAHSLGMGFHACASPVFREGRCKLCISVSFNARGCSRMRTALPPGGRVYPHVHNPQDEVGHLCMCTDPLRKGGSSRMLTAPPRGRRLFTHAHSPAG